MGCYRFRAAASAAGGAAPASASGSSDHGGSSCAGDADEIEWEVRPCGMLVQKRVLAPPTAAAAAGECTSSTAATTSGSRWKKKTKQQQEMIRVRVAYGGSRYDVAVHYQATFGELKKLLSVETGLRPADQRLAFKGRDRRDGDYLDLCGVKQGSKLVLEEDACSKERRYADMEKAAREHALQRAVGDVAMGVERLADQVACIDSSVSRGAKVAEAQITTLIEMLIRQAVRLDAVPVPSDQEENRELTSSTSSSLASQKHIQAKRIQKCVEALDVLLLSNARINNNSHHHQPQPNTKPLASTTTHWQTFDTTATLNPRPTTTTTDWESFD